MATPTGAFKEDAQTLIDAVVPAADRGRGPGLGPARDRGPPRRRDHRRPGRLAGPRRARLLGSCPRCRRAGPPVPRRADHGTGPDAGRVARAARRSTRRRRSRCAAARTSTPASSRASSTAWSMPGRPPSSPRTRATRARDCPAWTPDKLDAFVAEADRRGWQVELHAIGDRGVRMALDAFERAAAANGPWTGDPRGLGVAPGTHGRRHRVEHVEMIDDADVPRFGRLGVVASMQPYHGDPTPAQIAPWAAQHRRPGAERLVVASDPRRRRDPRVRVGLAGRALSTRSSRSTTRSTGRPSAASRRAAGPPSGCRSREALEAYTAGSAWAAYADHRRGRIVPGMDADLVVLDRDLLAAGPSAIIGTGVALTVLGGRIVHRSEGTG